MTRAYNTGAPARPEKWFRYNHPRQTVGIIPQSTNKRPTTSKYGSDDGRRAGERYGAAWQRLLRLYVGLSSWGAANVWGQGRVTWVVGPHSSADADAGCPQLDAMWKEETDAV